MNLSSFVSQSFVFVLIQPRKCQFALCVKIPQSAGEFVSVDALVIWVMLVDAARPHTAEGSPEKALFESAAREKQ